MLMLVLAVGLVLPVPTTSQVLAGAPVNRFQNVGNASGTVNLMAYDTSGGRIQLWRPGFEPR